MEIFRIAAFVLVAAVLIGLIRERLPSYGILCLLGCSVVLLLYLLQLAAPLIEQLSAYADYGEQTGFSTVIKAAGIALASQTTQDLCRDAGLSSLAGKVEFAGRCLILMCTLPLFQIAAESLAAFLQ